MNGSPLAVLWAGPAIVVASLTGLLLLWATQFAFSLGSLENTVHWAITWIYLAWCAIEVIRLLTGNRPALALRHFRAILSTQC